MCELGCVNSLSSIVESSRNLAANFLDNPDFSSNFQKKTIIKTSINEAKKHSALIYDCSAIKYCTIDVTNPSQ